MTELRFLWKSTSQKQMGKHFFWQKKLDASIMPPCELLLLNKTRRTEFAEKIWMSSIEASPPNKSPLDSGWKLADRNYELLWLEGDLPPSSPDITYECEKHDGKQGMFLLLFLIASFCCIFTWSLNKIDVSLIIETNMRFVYLIL